MKYSSRKFIITLSVALMTFGLAYLDKMTGDTGIVFAACVAAYNWANVKATNADV